MGATSSFVGGKTTATGKRKRSHPRHRPKGTKTEGKEKGKIDGNYGLVPWASSCYQEKGRKKRLERGGALLYLRLVEGETKKKSHKRKRERRGGITIVLSGKKDFCRRGE